MSKVLVICDHAATCERVQCLHHAPHEVESECEQKDCSDAAHCVFLNTEVRCVEVKEEQ